jgi:hypothetical protein
MYISDGFGFLTGSGSGMISSSSSLMSMGMLKPLGCWLGIRMCVSVFRECVLMSKGKKVEALVLLNICIQVRVCVFRVPWSNLWKDCIMGRKCV